MKIEAIKLETTPVQLQQVPNFEIVTLKSKGEFGPGSLYVVLGSVEDGKVLLTTLNASRNRYLDESAAVYQVKQIVFEPEVSS